MADVMVTGRMSKAKKDAGNHVLSSLGMSTSEAINQLYDYLIQTQSLPFAQKKPKKLTPSQIQEAQAFVLAVPQQNSFSHMSDAEIKKHKLQGILS